MKERQSNIELLRIVAMFLVMVIHTACLGTGGTPTIADYQVSPFQSIARLFFDSVSIECVNVFVLISGWFGINATLKGFLKFAFQCLYFYFGIYTVLIIIGKAKLSYMGVLYCFNIFAPYWFVLAYTALYMFAPILNNYIENSSKRKLQSTLLLFYVFQSVYGWSNSAWFVSDGYSCFSFVGLYLLARYIRLYGFRYSNNGALIYWSAVVLNILLAYTLTLRNSSTFDAFSYVNPLCVIASLGLFLWFVNLKIRPNISINWVAKSSFAVYLLHVNYYIFPRFLRLMGAVYKHYSNFSYFAIVIAILLAIFVVAVLLDQPRKWIWSKILVPLSDKKLKFKNEWFPLSVGGDTERNFD